MIPTLRDLAEDAFAYMEGPVIEFDRRPEFVLRNGPNPHPMRMSKPILERLGFETVCEMHTLVELTS
jgi:hypothetical protein